MVHALALSVALTKSRCPVSAIPNFPQHVACERADGTLRSMSIYPGVEWRVRYYLKYTVMPCSEWPTEEESYVVDMAYNDLYNDKDLNDTERVEIRNAMYDGPQNPRCP